jgi:hypothetical protein
MWTNEALTFPISTRLQLVALGTLREHQTSGTAPFYTPLRDLLSSKSVSGSTVLVTFNHSLSVQQQSTDNHPFIRELVVAID